MDAGICVYTIGLDRLGKIGHSNVDDLDGLRPSTLGSGYNRATDITCLFLPVEMGAFRHPIMEVFYETISILT